MPEGWPLTEKRVPAKLLRSDLIGNLKNHAIYRQTYEILPDLPFTGLLFLRDPDTPRPLLISQHGGGGTPELCSSLYESGSSNYNELTQRLLAWDVNVFAPQLCLWSTAGGDGDTLRRELDAQLKGCGSSVTAVELYALSAVLDSLCGKPFTDPDRIGMAGLSYGGFYTLMLTAMDTRIRSAVASGNFGAIADNQVPAWFDWIWQGCRSRFLDAELAALCYPRRMRLELGDHDPLFSAEIARAEYGRMLSMAGDRPVSDFVTLSVFDGNHEFSWDTDRVEGMMWDLGAARLCPDPERPAPEAENSNT